MYANASLESSREPVRMQDLSGDVSCDTSNPRQSLTSFSHRPCLSSPSLPLTPYPSLYIPAPPTIASRAATRYNSTMTPPPQTHARSSSRCASRVRQSRGRDVRKWPGTSVCVVRRGRWWWVVGVSGCPCGLYILYILLYYFTELYKITKYFFSKKKHLEK